MNDEEIVDLFWQRDEEAIAVTSARYGALCRKIAYGILGNAQDSEEIVNHAYLKLWNAVPPKRPLPFMPFLAKIVRNLALNQLKAEHTQKSIAANSRYRWTSWTSAFLTRTAKGAAQDRYATA